MTDQFLAGMSGGDWINSGILLAAAITLFFTACAFRLQARAMDFSSYLDLMTRFSDAWRRFRDAKEGSERDYEFRELLNLIEASCHLWRRSVFGRASNEMMKDYLKENISAIADDDYGKRHLREAVSGSGTFSEIKLFSRKHGLCWPDCNTA